MIFNKISNSINFIYVYLPPLIYLMKTKYLFIICLVVFSATMCLAGPPPPPPSGGSPTCWPPPCVPIDGGISLLIAAGAIYGGKKLYNNRKEKDSI